MKKAKLKTFTDLSKKIKVKASNNQEVVLEAEKRLFARMIVIAEYRNLHISEVLSDRFHEHLLSEMARCARRIKPHWQRNSIGMYKPQMLFPNQHQHDSVTDGMNLVQHLRGSQKTFAEIAEFLLSVALDEGTSSDRIDVVFDDYREDAIKSAERESEFRSLQADHQVKQWRKFLCSSQNKQALIVFVTKE